MWALTCRRRRGAKGEKVPGANPSSLPDGTARVVGGRATHGNPPNGQLLVSLLLLIMAIPSGPIDTDDSK